MDMNTLFMCPIQPRANTIVRYRWLAIRFCFTFLLIFIRGGIINWFVSLLNGPGSLHSSMVDSHILFPHTHLSSLPTYRSTPPSDTVLNGQKRERDTMCIIQNYSPDTFSISIFFSVLALALLFPIWLVDLCVPDENECRWESECRARMVGFADRVELGSFGDWKKLAHLKFCYMANLVFFFWVFRGRRRVVTGGETEKEILVAALMYS